MCIILLLCECNAIIHKYKSNEILKKKKKEKKKGVDFCQCMVGSMVNACFVWAWA